MKKMLKFKTFAVLLAGWFMVSTLVSCEQEDPEAPELPPMESLMMDFSDFEQGAEKSAQLTHANWGYSAATVGFWNLYATLVSAVPVAAYGHALQQEAVYLGDHTWEWSFSFSLQNLEYEAVLTAARLNNEEFTAEMSINLAAFPNQQVRWFDGVVRYDHTHASWTIYKDGSVEMLGIEWNADFEKDMADLTYTYLEEGAPEKGSYIMWSYNSMEDFDASYNVSLAESYVDIEWSTTDLDGRVKAPAHFGDDLWHCWDTQAMGLADKACE